MEEMDWVKNATVMFKAPKPEHFTNFEHCEECASHDQTLLQADIATIGLEELGNPGWDPICFTSAEGKKYYVPAFIRLSLDSIDADFYLEQFIFHLQADGPDFDFFNGCTIEQRQFIASFLAYIIESSAAQLEDNLCADTILVCYEFWSS